MQKSVTVVLIAFFAILANLAAVKPSTASTASGAWDGYGAVALQARVADRIGAPVPGVSVRFVAQLDGIARGASSAASGEPAFTSPFVKTVRVAAVTNTDGVATALVPSAPLITSGNWFRGAVRFTAQAVQAVASNASNTVREVCSAGPDLVRGLLTVPAVTRAGEGPLNAPPTLRIWEAPDRYVDGFPLWLGRDKRADRVVVLVEGFDLYNGYSATDTLRLVGAAGDALRGAGMDLLAVNFADSHQSPDQLAPTVARAIRAASMASGGRSVAVAGLSAGGITARWAMVTAEEQGASLPVHTLIFLDTPHRGARLNPVLQALVLRYGKKADRDALTSEAARALLTECVTDPARQVRWRRIGPPLAQREIPARCAPTGDLHDAFYERLRRLNDRNGYPKRCRLVAVANSSRHAARRASKANLLRLWLPMGSGWTLKADDGDCASGSLLPRLYVNQFRTRYPLGVAGAYLSTIPTFLPSESALDAGPEETPPFDAWYARPDGLAPLAHDEVDPGAGAFVVRELLQSAWGR